MSVAVVLCTQSQGQIQAGDRRGGRCTNQTTGRLPKGGGGDIALNVSSYSQFGTFVHTSGFLREDGPPAVTLAPGSAHTLIMFGALWPSLDGLYLTQVYSSHAQMAGTEPENIPLWRNYHVYPMSAMGRSKHNRQMLKRVLEVVQLHFNRNGL